MHKQFIELSELLTYVRQSTGSDPKGVCELGELPPQLVERIKLYTGIDTQNYRLTLDSYGVRHAFTGHSHEWGSHDHYPLAEADILAVPSWVFAPATIQKGLSSWRLTSFSGYSGSIWSINSP